jgi:hypothetical protein
MNVALWFLQAILAVKFATVAFTHGLRQDQATMQQGIEKMGASTRPLLSLIAAVLFLGCVGLVGPGAFGLLTWLTPYMAAVLAVIMLLSIPLHLKCREKPKVFASIILLIMSAFVAYGRWFIDPL